MTTTPTTTGYLELDGGRLYYEMAGQGETLVLGHAGFVDRRMWDDQWAAFTPHYRVIRFDLRGYGQSDPLEGPVSRRDDLRRLLEHLEVERAVLIGCSMSGEAVLDYTLEHPDKVTALVLVSTVPTGFEMQGPPPPNLMEMIGALQQGDLDQASELQLRIWVDGSFRQPEQVDPSVRQRAAAMNRIGVGNGTWAKADSQPLDPPEPPALPRLGEVDVPTLIIAGALDHPEILRAADVMAAEIPDARKIILPDSAHVPNMEQPAAFNQAVLQFLASIQS
ncbi:MAG: alpha/beta hydrolase [Anaerolineae bacterium]|nr:alpha/beta hydrolase [Anaerolineae bacterium]